MQACDVLILGAGPAGCATAIALLAAGVERVRLVDKPLAYPFRIGESATPDIPALLAELGLESDLARLGHCPYHGNLSLWGNDQPQLDHFLLRGRGHGWHLDRGAFDGWLKQEAVARGARLVSPSGLDAVTLHDGGWRISVRNFGEVDARVIVDAGGRRSPLASRLGVRRQQIDNLTAIAACLPCVGGMEGLSLVESFADGWWYATRLPDGRALVTLMTDADIGKARRFAAPGTFSRALRATRLIAGHVEAADDTPVVGTFAAHSGYAERAAGSNWIAVGDALMGFDPLTSSGISGALSDALTAAPAILEQLDGKHEKARAYAGRADSTFRRFLTERRKHYEAEQRWQDRPFWSRRNGQVMAETPKSEQGAASRRGAAFAAQENSD